MSSGNTPDPQGFQAQDVAWPSSIAAYAPACEAIMSWMSRDTWLGQDEFDKRSREIQSSPGWALMPNGYTPETILLPFDGDPLITILQHLQFCGIIESRKRENGKVEYRQRTPKGWAQDVALLPSQLRMIAAALEANKQSFSAAMVVKAADRIEELEQGPKDAMLYVTDFDRIQGGMWSELPGAIAKAEALAAAHPGNSIHVMRSFAIARKDR